ncbi:MAG: helix-turn-helix domain-containing protein [Defluviitaleaceae bacterium]|nr:helix-turn-helix domain-containing protein [Defluviitaleaceae bacterium]
MINGAKIKQLREDTGISQAELGKEAGVSSVAIHYVETGKKSVQINTLAFIASALGVSVDDLLLKPQQTRQGEAS